MRFSVVCMRRRGVPIAKEKLARERAAVGELLVVEHRDAVLGRTMRVAQLKDPSEPIAGELLPALHDVQLLWVAPQGLTIGGFERIEVGRVMTDYAQTWWCRGL
jgi:hypothetical protein